MRPTYSHRHLWLLVVLPAALLAACERQRASAHEDLPSSVGVPQRNLDASVVGDYDPAVDYFPDKLSFRHAEQLEVEYHPHYKVVRLETLGMAEEFEFVLVQRGTPRPEVRRDAMVVQVPVSRYSLGTFRYGRASEILGIVDRLVGFSNHNHASVPSILALFENGKLKRNFNLEAIAERATEAHFEWYFPAALRTRSDTQRRLGIPGIPMAEHLEPTPVARAEWLKFLALFFNKEREANEAFDAIEAAYLEARSAAPGGPARPKVLVGAMEKDGWSIHGGRNLMAQMIEDAGGHYLWQDNDSREANTLIAFEAALLRAREADVWLLGPNFTFGDTLEQRTIDDPRFAFVPAVAAGRVYVEHANYPDGLNPWWDYALVEPHLELRDLIAILNAEEPAAEELRFFRKLDREETGP